MKIKRKDLVRYLLIFLVVVFIILVGGYLVYCLVYKMIAPAAADFSRLSDFN